jgi:chromosome segregation ATPase
MLAFRILEMDLLGEVDELMRELDQSQQAFDRWAADQVEFFHGLQAECRDTKSRFESELQVLTRERRQMEDQIRQTKSAQVKLLQQSKVQTDEHRAIQSELKKIPKDIKYLENLHYILQLRRERLSRDTPSAQSDSAAELRSFESLYGLCIRHDGNKTTFNFKIPQASVVLQQDENQNYRIVKAPSAVTAQQAQLLAELNQKRDLLRFLIAVRRCILSP